MEEAIFVGFSQDSRHAIRCTRCGGTHNSIEGTRACHEGKEIGSCEHQYYLREYTEDGLRMLEECGMDAWATGRGSTCAYGHEYVDMETRWREGWDYAADEGEAYLLRLYGRDAVSMRGDSI